jgi:hypothetical protein
LRRREEQAQELLRVGRLDDVEIDAGLARAPQRPT